MNHSVLDELKKVGSFVHIFLPRSHLALLPTCCQRLKISARVIIEHRISICISVFLRLALVLRQLGAFHSGRWASAGDLLRTPGHAGT